MCLMSTKPFQGCQDEHVWALHYTPHEAFRCHNRPALVEHLADALLEYECALRVYAQDANALQELAKQTVQNAEVMAKAYARLPHRRQGAQTPERQRPRAKRVAEALQVLTSMEQALSGARDQQFAQSKNVWRARLGERMYVLFERYGPSYKDYRDIAVYAALATIFLQLGIEEADNPEAVAARVRVRRTRRKKRPNSSP
jgi:hypothetical protein